MEIDQVKYSSEDGPYGPELVLNGPWSDSLIPLFETQFSGLWVNYARGFQGDNLGFLEKLPLLKSLTIIVYNISDISPINSLHELRFLSLGNIKFKGIDFSNLPNLERCGIDWPSSAWTFDQCVALKSLYLSHYQREDVADLANLKQLERLRLANSPLKSVHGLAELTSLRRLGLYNLRVMSDISSLGDRPELTALDIVGCRKFGDIEPVSRLEHLRYFGLDNCGDIESIKPISNLRELILVSFFDTNIVDGDMTPLVGLPELGLTIFRDKKNYTHKMSDFPKLFSATPWI